MKVKSLFEILGEKNGPAPLARINVTKSEPSEPVVITPIYRKVEPSEPVAVVPIYPESEPNEPVVVKIVRVVEAK